MLERVDSRVMQRGLVEHGRVPGEQVDRPDWKRDERMREHTQPVDPVHAQDRCDQRPAQTQHDQQRADVGHQQVLDHVDCE